MTDKGKFAKEQIEDLIWQEKFLVTYIDYIGKMLVNPPTWSKYHHDK